MKKKRMYLASICFLCMLLVMPTAKAMAAAPKILSVSALYQNSTKVTGKATPGYVLKLRLNKKTYRTVSRKNGVYTFSKTAKAKIGDKATLTIYDKKAKAVGQKTLTVKGNLAFRVTGYDSLNHVVKGNGTAGKKVRVRVGSRLYTTTVSSSGTWKKTVPASAGGKTVKVSQQKSGKTYSAEKKAALKKSKFNTAYIKKGVTYYTKGYHANPRTSWVGFKVKEVIGNKIYFSYTVCEVKNGVGKPQTLSGVGTVTGKNTMSFQYTTGISGKFTWINSKTLKVVGTDRVFTNSVRTEILTAK